MYGFAADKVCAGDLPGDPSVIAKIRARIKLQVAAIEFVRDLAMEPPFRSPIKDEIGLNTFTETLNMMVMTLRELLEES